MLSAHHTQALWLIAVMAVVTFVLRALPFLAERWLRRMGWITRLGRFLPAAIMTLLLVHTLAQTSGARLSASADPASQAGSGHSQTWLALPHAPEVLAALVVLILHRWQRNTLLSIGAGTLFYVGMRWVG